MSIDLLHKLKGCATKPSSIKKFLHISLASIAQHQKINNRSPSNNQKYQVSWFYFHIHRNMMLLCYMYHWGTDLWVVERHTASVKFWNDTEFIHVMVCLFAKSIQFHASGMGIEGLLTHTSHSSLQRLLNRMVRWP